MTEETKSETTDQIRELTQDEIAAVSGGGFHQMVPPPLGGTSSLEAPPTGNATHTIVFDGRVIGRS
jgi:hypothetical protein